MGRGGTLLFAMTFIASLGSQARAQQALQAYPIGPFKTVHLMVVPPGKEAILMAAVKDFNRGFAEQGCSSCVYRIFKAAVAKDSRYNYMMTADWPGRDEYLKIHASPAFEAASRRNPIMGDLADTEFYGRYVEIK